MQVHSRRAIALASATVAAAGLALAAAPTAANAAPSGTVTIQNTLPRWLSTATKNTMTANAVSQQSVRVYLAPKGGLDALKARVDAVSDPSSAAYRHWISTNQYNATYAPTQAEVDSVSKYVSGAGLKVTGVESSRRYVSVSGTPAQLGAAFGVQMGSYTHDGQTVTAPDRAASLPAAVGANVLTITGLDTTANPKKHNDVTPDVTPPVGFVNGKPCAINYGNPLATYQADYTTPLPQFQGQTLSYAPCGYTGPQFRAAYENGLGIYGNGATVAITDAYSWPRIAQDANTYAVRNGDGAYAPGQLTVVESPNGYNRGNACDPTGWSGEQTLDVEAVHAMAPNSKIRYYASASCFDDDFLDTLARVVDDNQAQLVSNSWSDLEANESAANVAAYEQVFLQGALQGISFLFSSGDNGDELANTGVKQVDYPSSDPYVTAAGGTSTGIANGRIVTQTGWGSRTFSLSKNGQNWVPGGFLYGAGGGYSSLFGRPSYQNSKVPASAPAGRAVPDIAMDADPNTGMLIGQTQQFPDGNHYGEYRIGGTSLASPMLAGFMALAVQVSGGGLGLLNPTLYRTASAHITDVTPVSAKGVVRVNNNNGFDNTDGVSYIVRTFDQDSSLKTATGWDPVTGLGVPNPRFIVSLAAAPPAAGAMQHGAPQG